MTKYASNFNNTLPFCDVGAKIALAATTELTYTVPGDTSQNYKAIFHWLYDSAVWVSINQTAVIPTAGTVSTGYNTVLRPDTKYVRGGDVLHFIAGAVVTGASLELFLLPS